MRVTNFIAFIYLLSHLSLSAQVTYTKDVAGIIYNKCANCHRQGEIGPFTLTNYDEVRSYGETIKLVTKTRYMPPWKADPDFQHYLEENYLSSEEIEKIGQWVDAGMPYGNAFEEPEFPDFPDGSALGQPDLTLHFTSSYLHKGNGEDEYRYFVLPTGLTKNKIIKAIELRPGNKKIVHHALFFQDTTGKAKSFDEMTPEYGFSANTSGFDVNSVLLYEQYPGYVPGQKPIRYPETFGQRMSKGSDLVIQMHYAPTPIDELDSTTVNIFFADENETITRFVKDRIMLPTDLPNGFFGFVIPANQQKTFTGKWKTTEDLSFISIFPHMHLLGKKWNVWVEKPDGSRENLIKIDDWDFNWQGGYFFTKPIIAPKGSTVIAEALYDNTTGNEVNPNNPPKTVRWGQKTSDEMYYLPILHTPYRTGDENLFFGTLTSTLDVEKPLSEMGLNVFPNPAKSELIHISMQFNKAGKINLYVTDQNGKLVKTIRVGEFFNKGFSVVHLDAANLNTGTYFIVAEHEGSLTSRKIQIIK